MTTDARWIRPVGGVSLARKEILMKTARSLPILLLAATLGLGACATGRNVQVESSSTPTARRGVQVNVQNDNTDDVDVYVMGGGQVWRLGHVTGLSNATLTIPASIVASSPELRLLADPLAAFNAYLSDPITVTSGDTVQFQIGSALGLSNVSVF
jgi:hypothetical protein